MSGVGRSREAVKAGRAAGNGEAARGGHRRRVFNAPQLPALCRIDCTVALCLGSRDADASRAERLSLRPFPFLFLMATPADFISRGGLLVAPELRRPADRRFLGDQADSFINSSSTSRRAAPFPDTERPSCIQRAAHQKAERPGQRQTPMTLPDACPPTPTDRSPYRSTSVASASR